MTTVPHHDPREGDAYFNEWVRWSVNQLIRHLSIALGGVAAVFIVHGIASMRMSVWTALAMIAGVIAYLLVATSPTRLEPKFHRTHPYSEYVE